MDSLLNLINKNIVFENKIYKIVKLSRIYIYGLEYKTDQQLVLNNDILLHRKENKKFYSSFFTNSNKNLQNLAHQTFIIIKY